MAPIQLQLHKIPPANINSVWLGLRDTGYLNPAGGTTLLFSSTFTINPQKRVIGTHFYAY